MPIQLQYLRPYLSLEPFDPIQLPDFTVLTGLNGSGKTHLLRSITDGAVRVEGVELSQVRLFDWTTFIPKDENSFQSHQLSSERDNIASAFQQARAVYLPQIQTAGGGIGLPDRYLRDPKDFLALTEEKLRAILSDPSKVVQATRILAQWRANVEAQLRNGLSQPILDQVSAISRQTGIPVAVFDRDTLAEYLPVSWGMVDPFQQSFSRLFVAYRDLWLRNELKAYARSRGQATEALTPQEFVARYNEPPWTFINEMLLNAGLDFQIDQPDLYSQEPYQAMLRKRSSDVALNFGSLSSGEKVLMSFATCIYYATDRRQISTFPKLLLLDEIDAPLHPSMSRAVIRSIGETLVEKHRIAVVLTSHSPSTVALAPDDAVHVMEAGKGGVWKTTKAQALNLLTAGVPTLGISYSGRRQIFVESEVDCAIYESIYSLLKGKLLQSERSLDFIWPGYKAGHTQAGAGCEQVKSIVERLREVSVRSVYGLIDWDGRHKPTPHLAVLAHGARNGLENCVFDPLVVACLITRDADDRCEAIGLKPRSGFMQLKNRAPEQLQAIATAVEALVLGSARNAKRRSCGYAGGLSLELDTNYLSLDDHKLEEWLVRAVPALEKYRRRAGDLMKHVVTKVLPDYPEFIPLEFESVFNELLNKDEH